MCQLTHNGPRHRARDFGVYTVSDALKKLLQAYLMTS